MGLKDRRTLAMLAKYWEPGRVKTRLAAVIGESTAADLQQSFVRHLGRQLSHVGDRRFVAAEPENRTQEIAVEVGPMWSVTSQGNGDLGTRLVRVFRAAMAIGGRSIVIGSDSPDLPAEVIESAFSTLRQSPAVLGPAHDGGVYLIGFRGGFTDAHLRVLEGIQWSTDVVCQQLQANLKEANMPFTMLPSWWDVDQYEDLITLDQRLRTSLKDGQLRQAVRNAKMAPKPLNWSPGTGDSTVAGKT